MVTALVASAVIGAVATIGTGVINYFSSSKQSKAAKSVANTNSAAATKMSDNEVVISREQTKQAQEGTKSVQSTATSNIVSDYYSTQKAEAQGDTIVKVVVVLAIMLVLVTRIKKT